ncbi:MAG: type III pantothenate kinase [Planctomycetota bacterium]
MITLPGQLDASGPQSVPLVAVSVGNTRTAWASVEDAEPSPRQVAAHDDPERTAAAIAEHAAAAGESAPVVLASVSEPASTALIPRIEAALGREVYLIGRDVPIPIERAIDADTTPGLDRLLNALAAFDVMGQACVVVDAGTAVTVDFVDGEGTFQGGAIAPGLAMMLRALHEGTASLPLVVPALPDGGEQAPFAKRTEQALLVGATASVQGLVRLLTERYAIAYDAYPQVVVTGGDAALLFDGDELIDRIVPDLTLRGIALACRRALAGAADDEA